MKWAIFTVLAFLFFEILGGAIVLSYFYKGTLTPSLVTAYLVDHPVHTVFMWFCGLGGYLLMRYRIDKLPTPGQDGDSQ
mgnify:CR=1 FL=1